MLNPRSILCAVGLAFALALSTKALAVEIVTHPYRSGVIRSCHIDLRKDALQMFWRDDKGVAYGNFQRLQQWLRPQAEELICATNGGIYQEDLRPLGLYVENGRVLHRLNTRKGAYGNFYFEPNGVFIIEDRRARIVDTDRFQAESASSARSVRFATQSGPILVQNGEINPRFTPASTNRLIRNAVCIVSSQKVILAMSDTVVSFYEFSRFLRDTLKCTDALHMDSSVSQFLPHDGIQLGPSFGVIIAVTRTARTTGSR
jgi:uncharacterized protein YigE (DUF2233 family)